SRCNDDFGGLHRRRADFCDQLESESRTGRRHRTAAARSLADRQADRGDRRHHTRNGGVGDRSRGRQRCGAQRHPRSKGSLQANAAIPCRAWRSKSHRVLGSRVMAETTSQVIAGRESPSVPAERGFVRAIGLFDGTMIVVGSMIGSGIFIVAAEISRQTGSPAGLLLTWIITGLLTVSAALSYGELAALLPRPCGQEIYLRERYS